MTKFLKEIYPPILSIFLAILIAYVIIKGFGIKRIKEQEAERKQSMIECQQKTNDFEWCYGVFIE